MFGGGSKLTANQLETDYRPVAFALALAFAFRYHFAGYYDLRRLLNFVTFAFIIVHMFLKASENSGADAVMAALTVLLFHSIASVLVPAFVVFNLTDLFLGCTDFLMGQVGMYEVAEFMALVPSILVTIIWAIIFTYVDQGLISLFDIIGIFTKMQVATKYKIL